ncbi:MAG: hypothetical protein OEZ22_14205 [Spirochaetia bacterium]|nr:hypothetical protein [Spirochaetia bacterium]
MRKKIFIIIILIKTSFLYTQEIEDAPTDDLLIETEQKTDSVKNYRYRLFFVSFINYNHLKIEPEKENQGQGMLSFFEERSAVCELNSELLYKIPGIFTFKGDIQGQYSTSFSKSTLLFEKGYQDYVRINELFFEIFFYDNISFLTGKYRRIYTPGIFQNPLDLHNPISSMPGQQAKRDGAYIAQLNVNYNLNYKYIESGEIILGFLPMFYQNKFGIFSENKDYFFLEKTPNEKYQLSKREKEWKTDEMGIFSRFYFDIIKGDLNLIYYYLNQQSQYGFSYAKYLLNFFELHIETIFYKNPRYNFVTNNKNLYFDTLIGSRIEYDDFSGVTAEYIYNGEKPNKLPQSMPDRLKIFSSLLNESRSNDFLTPLQDYLVFSAYMREIKDVYAVTFNVLYGIYHKEAFYSLRFDAKSGNTAVFSITGGITTGGENSFYGGIIPFDYKISSELLVSF